MPPARTALVGAAATIALTVTAGSAAAQPPVVVGPGVAVGIGVGPYYGPRAWPWYGPGLYGWGWPWWPGAAGSFWTNGLSLAGPPVPTFAPVPGVFGGGDAHRPLASGPAGLYDPFYWSAPALRGPAKDFPQAVLPPGYSGPRFATRDVKRRFAEQAADPMLGIDRAYQDLARAYGGRLIQPCLRLRVLVPAGAEVWIQDRPMAATGTDRLFESPPLTPGSTYAYTVTAKLPGGRAETKTVAGRPGETVAVDFNPAKRP
jgi:uncharacterized protein (TIGR03000 family)